MTSATDIYGDYSEFYDYYVGDWHLDLPFYLDYARLIQTPILEAGCGSGRLTLPLAKKGHEVVGVDISPSMLAILRSHLDEEPEEMRRKIRIIEGDICGLRLEERFDLILAPFYVLNYFLTDESIKAALERFAEWLRPDGKVLADTFVPWTHIESCPKEEIPKVDTMDPETGARILGWIRYSLDREKRIETRTHRFLVIPTDEEPFEKEFVTERRYFSPDEMNSLLRESGFKAEIVYTGYGREPADDRSEQRLYVLRRA